VADLIEDFIAASGSDDTALEATRY
jgi:hypothetical protein